MTVHQAQRAVVEDKAKKKGTLRPVRQSLPYNFYTRTNLVAVQTAHSTFDLSSVDVTDLMTLGGFDENTAEQSNHASGMQKMVRLIGRHAILNASNKIVTPGSVLPAHVVLL